VASLTNILPEPSPRARIIDPGPQGPSFLEGLANLASGVLTGGVNRYERMSQARRRSAADALEQREAEAENAAARVRYNFMTGDMERVATGSPAPAPQARGGYVPFDSSLEGPPLPPGVERGRDEAVRAQQAENQGRAPQGSARIVLENQVSQLLRDYPDQTHTIMEYFRVAGLDHYLFRERELNRQIEESRVEGSLAGERAYYDAAVSAGMVTQNMSWEDAVSIGRTIQAEQFNFERARERAQAAREATTGSRDQIDWERREGEREMVGSVINSALAAVNPILNIFVERAAEAQLRPENQAIFDQEIQEVNLTIQSLRANGLQQLAAAGASQEAIREYERQFDAAAQAFTNIVSGPMSQVEVRRRALNNIQTTLQLDTARALPLYTNLISIFGQGGVNQIFAGDIVRLIGQDNIDALRNEIQGVQDWSSPAGRVTMATLAGVLRGQLDINTLTEREARQAIPVLAETARGNSADIASGDLSAATPYANAAMGIMNAAVELQPGMPQEQYRSVPVVAGSILREVDAQAAIALLNNPETQAQGRSLTEGGRATAAHLLNVAKHQNQNLSRRQTMNGLWSTEYVARTGQWRAVITPENYDRWARSQPSNIPGRFSGEGRGIPVGGLDQLPHRTNLPSREELIRRGAPQALREHVGGMNLALNYLMTTHQYDETLRGVTRNEARAMFAENIIPQALRAQEERRATFEERGAEFRRELQEAREAAVESNRPTGNESVDRAMNFYTGRGYAPHIAAGIVGNLRAESGLDVSAVGDGGRALSLAQWHPDRRRNAEREGFDLTDFDSALAFVEWELNNTERSVRDRLMAARNVQEAADIFALHFLRPQGAQTGQADNVHNIEVRRRYAREALGPRTR